MRLVTDTQVLAAGPGLARYVERLVVVGQAVVGLVLVPPSRVPRFSVKLPWVGPSSGKPL
jgi:hypothetical protein